MKTQRRQTHENRASRIGLNLCKASKEIQMDAIGRGEHIPRWELNDGKHQDSKRGFATLAEVSEALDCLELRR